MSRVQAAMPAGGSADAFSQRRQSAASSAQAGTVNIGANARSTHRFIAPLPPTANTVTWPLINRDAGATSGTDLASAAINEGNKMIRLDGKVAIVTGATRSIGEYIARGLHA